MADSDDVQIPRDISYRFDRDVDAAAIADVYRSVGWDSFAKDVARLREALQSTSEVASAWDDEKAVGIARLLSDGAFQGYILGVAVRPEYQGRGVGSRLVQMLVDSNPSLHFHLRTSTRRFHFYERLGFQRHDTAMERPPASR